MFDLGFSVLVVALIVFAIFRMASTMTTTITWLMAEANEGAGIGTSITHSGTGNNLVIATISVPTSTTNQENAVAFDAEKLDSIIITTTADVTMYTNAASGGSPDDTITLKAGKPFVWFKDNGITRPIDGNSGAITSLFFTNGSSANAAVVRIRGVQTS